MLMHLPDIACSQFILTSVASLIPVGHQATTQPVEGAQVPADASELPSQLPPGFWQVSMPHCRQQVFGACSFANCDSSCRYRLPSHPCLGDTACLQELPPGIHSINMASRPTASSSMLPVGQAWLGGAPSRHDWQDQLLVQIQGFERPAALLGQAETGAAQPDALAAEAGGAAALLARVTAGGRVEAAAQQVNDCLLV